MPIGDLRPELALVVGSVVVLVFALFAPRSRQAGAAVIALATIGAAVMLAWSLAGDRQWLTFSDTYAVDQAARAAKVIILGTTAVVVALSVEWFKGDPRHGEYYSILLLSSLGAILLSGAADLSELLLGALLSTATGSVLIAYHRQSRKSAEAAIKYYLLGALTNALMIVGAVVLFGLAGSTTFSALAARLAASDVRALAPAFAFMAVGLAFKLGVLPAQAWVPDVAEGAPAPVAAFVTVVPKIGGFVALARLASLMPDAGVGWRPLVALLAALTMTLGNLAALRPENVRRLLGWSAVSQSGYALMAVVALHRSSLAVPSLVYFLGAYALGSLAAFAVVVCLDGRAERTGYDGLWASHPWLAIALVMSFLSFAGIPPTAGFVGKLALFGATIEAGYTWLAVVAAINTVVSLAYYARVLGPVFFGEARKESRLQHPWAAIAVGACTFGILMLGIGAGAALRGLATVLFLPR